MTTDRVKRSEALLSKYCKRRQTGATMKHPPELLHQPESRVPGKSDRSPPGSFYYLNSNYSYKLNSYWYLGMCNWTPSLSIQSAHQHHHHWRSGEQTWFHSRLIQIFVGMSDKHQLKGARTAFWAECWSFWLHVDPHGQCSSKGSCQFYCYYLLGWPEPIPGPSPGSRLGSSPESSPGSSPVRVLQFPAQQRVN